MQNFGGLNKVYYGQCESSEYLNYVTCLAEGGLQKSAQFRDYNFFLNK